MSARRAKRCIPSSFATLASFFLPLACLSAESPYLYGIHDHSPTPTDYLSHITSATGTGGWITATVAVGTDTNDMSGTDFTALSNANHTVICRINYGYYPDGTIPVISKYDAFAARCKNFATHSPGCHIWLIGNELNLAAEWPWDGARFSYISPADYANCFRKVYNAIKSVRPNDKILPQASAPWAGPYGAGTQNVNGTNYPADGQPLTWVQYENQMLSAITNSGPVDGIALHVGSRGYHYADIHSTNTFGSLGLYASFYVYKDWVDYGIPPALYSLPLYITECNGLNYWKGGGPPGEDLSLHYEAGWMQEVYAEINRYNQMAATNGRPIFRCINMYRWCAFCDGWNIDADASHPNPYKAQILSDLDAAAAFHYAWPTNITNTNPPPAPTGLNAVVGNGNVTLSWNSTPFATGYNVKRSNTNGGPYSIIASNITGSSFINTSYQPGTTYFYVVSGVNGFGEGPNSAQVTATPTNGLPDVVVTAINWTPAGALYAGLNSYFQATVLNQGSASTPNGVTLGVGFIVDGTQVAWSGGYSSPLAPGASVTLTADGGGAFGNGAWSATTGDHTILANVDDINRFPEGNENNNTFSKPFTVFATQPLPPVLAPVPNQIVNAGRSLGFVALGSDPQPGQTFADFESYAPGTTPVMFRLPSFSGTTGSFLDPAPNTAMVASSFPAGNTSSRALDINWSFKTNAVNPWLRLSTFGSASLPNPIVSFTQSVRFDIFAERDLKVGLGLRETNPTGAIGADGGTTGTIEYAGIPALTGSTPIPLRTVPASNWVSLTFNLTNEPISAFTGNGMLDSTTGKGVLEHLAFVPAAGPGVYHIYLDNFAVVPPSTLIYTLSNAPAGATINATNGTFSWTAPATSNLTTFTPTVVLTKNGLGSLTDSKTFTVTVVPPPIISNVVVSNGFLVISWRSYPGKAYRVQYRNDLQNADWLDLTPDVTATGLNASKSDPLGVGQRFFRILQLN